MSVGLGLARLLVLVGGAAIAILGLYLIALPGGPGTVVGIYTVLGGLALIVGALIERVRYRSKPRAMARRAAGGEPPGTSLEPRFRRTEEIFADPTSGRRMRVWIDSSNGERRYVAED
jgi:hypothetical protein